MMPAPDIPDYLAPKSIAGVREVAELIAAAEWAPSPYRDIQGNYVVARIALAIMHGAAVGLGPFASVQSIAVINDLPTIWGDGALALVEHSGLIEDRREDYVTDEEEGLTAICTMRRRHRPTPITGRFSTAMAELAGLTQKEGPWQSYPRRMLMMRARSWALRDGFSDVLRGLAIREEVEDYTGAAELPPVIEAATAPLATRRVVRSDRPRFAACSTFRRAVAPVEVVDAVTRASARQDSTVLAESETNGATSEPSATPIDARSQSPAPVPAIEATNPASIVPSKPKEVFTLVDAEGGFIEVTGTGALRSAFENLLTDRHLSPEQILGLWESNEIARATITRVYGVGALEAAEAHVQVAWERFKKDHAARRSLIKCVGTFAKERGRPRAIRSNSSNDRAVSPLKLALRVDARWPETRVLEHYLARLEALRKRGRNAAILTDFRRVNQSIEARLREALPGRINEIDAIYAEAAINAS
jgi:hypothetical protein